MIILPGILDGIRSRKDFSFSVNFGTRELNDTQAAELFSLRNKECWGAFHPSKFEKFELPNLPSDERRGKSQSQRIHNALYVLYEKRGKPGEWDDFYKNYTEQMIDWVLKQIDLVEQKGA